MKALSPFLFLAAFVTQVTAQQDTCTYDVIYVIPGASGVGEENFNRTKDHVKSVSQVLFNQFQDRIRVGVVEYAERDLEFLNVTVQNSTLFNIIGLNQCNSSVCIGNELDALGYLGRGSNYLGYGLERAIVEFRKSSRYPFAIKAIVALTSLSIDDSDRLSAWYDQSQTENISTIAIRIGDNVNLNHLQIIANGGASNASVYTANNYTALIEPSVITSAISDIPCPLPSTTTEPMTTSTRVGATQTMATEQTTSSAKSFSTWLTVWIASVAWIGISSYLHV